LQESVYRFEFFCLTFSGVAINLNQTVTDTPTGKTERTAKRRQAGVKSLPRKRSKGRKGNTIRDDPAAISVIVEFFLPFRFHSWFHLPSSRKQKNARLRAKAGIQEYGL